MEGCCLCFKYQQSVDSKQCSKNIDVLSKDIFGFFLDHPIFLTKKHFNQEEGRLAIEG